ncbi:Plasma membrane proteolipid 31 [Spathaspora sp. JA1]|nr:Plasma membrane proteolipid 31 [Spathaspora sp. JA1]
MCGCLSDLCLILISVFFPPLPVWIRRGICSCDSLINIALCILGYFPGLIHSWYIIAKYPPYSYQYKSDVYVVVRNDLESQMPPPSRSQRQAYPGQQQPEVHVHYHQSNSPPQQNQPLSGATNSNYGAVNEGSSAQAQNATPGAPPAYTEFDNKTQH